MRSRLIPLCAFLFQLSALGAPAENTLLEPTVVHSKISDALQVASKDTDQAIIDLRALLERTEDPELLANAHYNIAVLLQTNEEYELAADSFKLADLTSTSSTVRRDARYSLGGVYYTRSKPAPDEQPTIEGIGDRVRYLLKAADAYRSVLDIDPKDTGAAADTERVRREIQKLRDLKDQLEKRQQEMEKLRDQLKEQAEQQQQEADQSKSGEQPQDQQQQDQEEISEQTEQASQQLEQSNPSSSASEDLKEARQAQQRAEEAMERGDQQEAARQQQQAADKLKEAAEKIEQEAQQAQGESENQSTEKSQDESEQQGEESEQENAEPSEDEIDQLAKDLLDKERREREQRTYRAKGRPIRVEKDW